MPTYDYTCTACHHAWELEQRIVDDPARKCPKCGANKAKRLISSGAGFILKGSGWYADGYGSKKPSSSESKPEAPSAESKPEKKGDADAKKAGQTKSSEAKSDPKKPNSSGSAGGGTGGGSSGGGGGGTESKASAA